MAIVATKTEREKKALGKEDRGKTAQVFTVGGSRGSTPGIRYERPRGKIQWSGTRGARLQHSIGPTEYSRRVDGTN